MMSSERNQASERLSPQIVWRDDGHLSDVAVSALADAELSLLSSEALEHGDGCDACAARVAVELEIGVALDAALQRPDLEQAPAAVTVDVPRLRGPLGIGLAVALLGLLPSMGAVPEALSTWTSDGSRWLAAGAMVVKAMDQHAGASTLVTLSVAVLLVSVGVWIARRAPRQSAWVGGKHG
jgi:hypothetical protein